MNLIRGGYNHKSKSSVFRLFISIALSVTSALGVAYREIEVGVIYIL